MVDLHSHILYGWDDGAETMEDSLAMARIAVERGTRVMAATPHLYWHNTRVDPEMIRARVAEIDAAIRAETLPLHLVTGTEIPADWDNLTLIERGQALRLGDGKGVLFEVPFVQLPVRFKDLVFQLQVLGFTPLLAHPERCQVFLANPDAFYRNVGDDTPIQVTAGSLTGGFGETVYNLAWRLVTDERPVLISSDAHNVRNRKPGLEKARAALAERFGEEAALLMCDTNASAILENRPLRIANIPRAREADEPQGRFGRLKRALRGG
jgi:protein-tyrosine phosphatase